MARKRNAPLVHWALSAHAPQRYEVVVVVTETSGCPTLGGVGGIWIRGRHLVLLMHRFFHRILLFQFHQILAHCVVDLGSFC